MSLEQFSDPPLTKMIEELASASSLTLVVGAGVSVEAGLATWRGLLVDLLDRCASERLQLQDESIRSMWVNQILGGESPLGAAAVAEALAGPDLAAWIPAALYGGAPERFQPGAIARQVPALRTAFGPNLRVLTTNYDDLIEQAIQDAEIGVEVSAFTGPAGARVPANDAENQRIVHLHGFLARDGRHEGRVVLTERDYQQVVGTDWQRSEVGYALMNSTCLFIGSSLTDPNLLRYLHAHAGTAIAGHYALFTRQDAYSAETPRQVIEARELALGARWQSANLEIVFVDYYAEIAQALREAALAKRSGDSYRPLPTRLRAWRRRVGEVLFPADPDSFSQAQDLLQAALSEALSAAVATVDGLGYDPRGEVLAASLWVVDEAGAALTNWASTDRAHRDPATVDPVPVSEHSNWVAVRAFCRGAALGEPRDIYASRWKYIRALPLMNDDHIPVGAITIASMHAAGETMLDRMSDPIEAAFDDALTRASLDILDLPFSTE